MRQNFSNYLCFGKDKGSNNNNIHDCLHLNYFVTFFQAQSVHQLLEVALQIWMVETFREI